MIERLNEIGFEEVKVLEGKNGSQKYLVQFRKFGWSNIDFNIILDEKHSCVKFLRENMTLVDEESELDVMRCLSHLHDNHYGVYYIDKNTSQLMYKIELRAVDTEKLQGETLQKIISYVLNAYSKFRDVYLTHIRLKYDMPEFDISIVD